MGKLIVEYIAKLPDHENHLSSTKLYHNGEKAANDVFNYIDNLRPDLHWMQTIDKDGIKNSSYPHAIALFFGFKDKTDEDLCDSIVVKEVEFEDPENDPYRRFLSGMRGEFIDDMEKNEHTDYEKESYQFMIDLLTRMLDFTSS